MLYLNNSFVHPELDYLILQCRGVFPFIPTEFKQNPEFKLKLRVKGFLHLGNYDSTMSMSVDLGTLSEFFSLLLLVFSTKRHCLDINAMEILNAVRHNGKTAGNIIDTRSASAK